MLDMTGERFGRWEVIKISDTKPYRLECICDCGNIKTVAKYSLIRGDSTSCGCYRKELLSSSRKTHGLSGERRLHNIWSKMKRRCLGTDEIASKHYHDRGINYCEEWEDFEPFYKWSVGHGYSKELTLDRIDNDGNYHPDNCRWVDMKIQSRNRRGNRIFTINGVSRCISEWCEIYEINVSTVNSRIGRGMDEYEAITKPLTRKRKV